MKELHIVTGVHKRKIPLVGKEFGNYRIISDSIATDGKKTYWLVKCQCGNEQFIRQDILESGQASRCRKCSNKDKFIKNVELGKMHSVNYSPKHYGVGDLPKNIYNHYMMGAKRRNIEFNVSIEYLWNLFVSQQGLCALSGQKIYLRPENKTSTITKVDSKGHRNLDFSKFNASLDRKDSSLGYIEGNVQWVERKVNIIKRELKQDEFIKLCQDIVNHVNQKPS